MNVLVTYKDGVGFEAEARGHKVFCDQPSAGGGDDRGMSPPEFLLVSLGTCVAYYALQYLKTRGLPAQGLKVAVRATKASTPARLDSFLVEVEVPDLDERHRDGVFRAARSCLIHNTLHHPPAIEITLKSPVSEQAGTRLG